jgi:hypothetical protein
MFRTTQALRNEKLVIIGFYETFYRVRQMEATMT